MSLSNGATHVSWLHNTLLGVLKTHSVQWSSALIHWRWNMHTNPTPCSHSSVPVPQYSRYCGTGTAPSCFISSTTLMILDDQSSISMRQSNSYGTSECRLLTGSTVNSQQRCHNCRCAIVTAVELKQEDKKIGNIWTNNPQSISYHSTASTLLLMQDMFQMIIHCGCYVVNGYNEPLLHKILCAHTHTQNMLCM